MESPKQNEQFAKELIIKNSLDVAINYIKSNLYPEDVFDGEDLNTWAEENGYTKQ